MSRALGSPGLPLKLVARSSLIASRSRAPRTRRGFSSSASRPTHDKRSVRQAAYLDAHLRRAFGRSAWRTIDERLAHRRRRERTDHRRRRLRDGGAGTTYALLAE